MKKIKKAQIYFLVISLALVIVITVVVQKPLQTSNTDQSQQFVVVVDAGHGGVDPGGIGIKTKVKEADLNLTISKNLQQLLEAAGVRVVMTRTDENGLYGVYTKNYKKEDMAKRKAIIAQANPDVVVSVHMNRFTNKSLRGAQAFYNQNNSNGAQLAACVQEEFKSKLAESNREISYGDYFMVKCTSAAAIIAECGYLSNAEDEKLLCTEEYQHKVAYSIFCGIVRYLSLPSQMA